MYILSLTLQRVLILMKWCLMSSDVSWHIRDKLWPMPKHGSTKPLRPRKPEGSLGRTAQDGHLDSHTAPELCRSRSKHGAQRPQKARIDFAGFAACHSNAKCPRSVSLVALTASLRSGTKVATCSSGPSKKNKQAAGDHYADVFYSWDSLTVTNARGFYWHSN